MMEKIEAAPGRLQIVEEKLFLESFSKKSFFNSGEPETRGN
jgi:hypothetical protein